MVFSYHSVFLVFLLHVPFRSVPFLVVVHCVCVLHSFISVSGLVLFLSPPEYLQIFLGVPDTGILPDTSGICHDSPCDFPPKNAEKKTEEKKSFLFSKARVGEMLEWERC